MAPSATITSEVNMKKVTSRKYTIHVLNACLLCTFFCKWSSSTGILLNCIIFRNCLGAGKYPEGKDCGDRWGYGHDGTKTQVGGT